MENNIKIIADNFQFKGELENIKPITQGYINATYCLSFIDNDKTIRYILQNINTNVFRNPFELMENIDKITRHLKNKTIENNGNPSREVLKIIKTKDNKLLFNDSDKYWRAYSFIENATAYEKCENPNLFYNSAKAFGKFHNLLGDFDASVLHETIKDFHNTKKRYDDFLVAVKENKANRFSLAKEEIDFIINREKECDKIINLINSYDIPLRVTHNDTKLNNIMMDNETNEGICVLDLDTVMPGTVLFDFGDSIRFGASTASEDEKDLNKVSIDLNLFEEYTKGYLSETKNILTKCEINNLVFATKLITLEQAIRFLTDYLNGDTYYPVKYDNHNLVRARTQIKLVKEIEEKFDIMQEIVLKYM